MQKKSLYFKDHPYNLFQSVENSKFPLPTNSKGFIGKQEFQIKKDPNTLRILVLGASPLGKLPPKEENKNNNPNLTISHLLEKELNILSHKKNINKKFEVLNLSSTAYNSYENLLSYITKGRFYNPDLIISYQGVNDVLWSVMADGFVPDYSHSRKNNFAKQECFINDIFCKLPNSKLIDYLDRLFIKFKIKKPNGLIFSISKSLKLDTNFSSEKLNVMINNIEMLNAISNLYGAKLLNLTFLWNTQKKLVPSPIYRELKNKKFNKLFDSYFNKYLVEINRLILKNKSLKTFSMPKEKFDNSSFIDGVHFNLKGMQDFSSLVAKYLIKNYESFFNF